MTQMSEMASMTFSSAFDPATSALVQSMHKYVVCTSMHQYAQIAHCTSTAMTSFPSSVDPAQR